MFETQQYSETHSARRVIYNIYYVSYYKENLRTRRVRGCGCGGGAGGR